MAWSLHGLVSGMSFDPMISQRSVTCYYKFTIPSCFSCSSVFILSAGLKFAEADFERRLRTVNLDYEGWVQSDWFKCDIFIYWF